MSKIILSSAQSNADLLQKLKSTINDNANLSSSGYQASIGDAKTSAEGSLNVHVLVVGSNSKAAERDTDVNTYDLRVVLDDSNAVGSIGQVVAQLEELLLERDYTFVSTRAEGASKGNTTSASFGFLEAVKEGLCKDGGLFMPRNIPRLTAPELTYLAQSNKESKSNNYHHTAQFVVEKLLGLPSSFSSSSSRHGKLPVPSPITISSCITKAYGPARWNNLASSISPLTPLLCGQTTNTTAAESQLFPQLLANHDSVNVLEQYHGPTAAFKDFALQLFPGFFAVSTESDPNRYLILAATSGDTGVAAINGFIQNGAPDTKVMVLFPEEGVSPVQKAQMLSYSDGKRVQVVGLGADFDFCQSTVKRVFNDKAVAEKLLGTSGKPTVLSSANSINWGRLLPQIVYYIHAYCDLVASNKLASPLDKASTLPREFDVLVPSGNFGNILSCYVAKVMGLPVRKFVVASNSNDVLAEFVNTGVYDITHRKLTTTSSPSIDILRASNVERFLYFIHDGNTDKVRALMHQLDTDKKFTLDTDVFESKVKNVFWASTCSESRCQKVVKALFEASNGHRLFDPHTGVAAAVAEDYLAYVKSTGIERVPIVVASTAHWGKFPEPVMQSLGLDVTESDEDKANVVTHVQNMHETIQSQCPNAQPVPLSLKEAVASPPKVEPLVIASPSYEGIVNELLSFANK